MPKAQVGWFDTNVCWFENNILSCYFQGHFWKGYIDHFETPFTPFQRFGSFLWKILSLVIFCPSHCLRWHSDPFWGEITFETHNVETHNLTMRILKEKLTWHEITVISSHPALVERWRGSFDDCGRAWAQNKWLFNGNSLTVESTCFESWLLALKNTHETKTNKKQMTFQWQSFNIGIHLFQVMTST